MSSDLRLALYQQRNQPAIFKVPCVQSISHAELAYTFEMSKPHWVLSTLSERNGCQGDILTDPATCENFPIIFKLLYSIARKCILGFNQS